MLSIQRIEPITIRVISHASSDEHFPSSNAFLKNKRRMRRVQM
jgi:hypothetical protein